MSNPEDIVTRCPQCNTAFRVTLNQLAVADGQVRCGSCLAVFRAADHNAKEQNKTTTSPKASPAQEKTSTNQSSPTDSTSNNLAPKAATNSSPSTAEKNKAIEDTPAAPKQNTKPELDKQAKDTDREPAQKQSTPKAPAPKQQTVAPNEEQDTLISDEETSQLDLDGDIFDLDSENENKKTSLFDRSLGTIKEHKRESADESWAIKMLAELEEEENQKEEQKTQFIINPEPSNDNNELFDIDDEPKIEPSFDTDDDLGLYDDDDEPNEQNSSGYDQIDLNIELEADAKTTEPEAKDSPLYFDEDFITEEPERNNAYDLDSALDDIKAAEEAEEAVSISDDDIENAMHSRARYKDDPSDYLANIEPEPVEMAGLSSPSAQRWLWRIGVILLGLLLVLQIAIIRFDTLSKHPSYRSYYSSACKTLGCTLPALIDTQKIRTTNLIVRSHPRRKNALIIDAILINNAKFTQPFPALQLEFNDINDQLVAKRQLQPNEYLRGELAGAKQMANNQPIQLSIEIVDPGDTAVNYQLTVVQARAQK